MSDHIAGNYRNQECRTIQLETTRIRNIELYSRKLQESGMSGYIAGNYRNQECRTIQPETTGIRNVGPYSRKLQESGITDHRAGNYKNKECRIIQPETQESGMSHHIAGNYINQECRTIQPETTGIRKVGPYSRKLHESGMSDHIVGNTTLYAETMEPIIIKRRSLFQFCVMIEFANMILKNCFIRFLSVLLSSPIFIFSL